MLTSLKGKVTSSVEVPSKTNRDASARTVVTDDNTSGSFDGDEPMPLPPSSSGRGQFLPKSSRYSRRVSGFEIDRRLLKQAGADLRNNKNVQELTIDKLRYDRVGFVGRDKETKTLQNCLDRMTSDEGNGSKELVLIKGYSGTGKSKLASNLQNHQKMKSSGLYVEGKFDFNNDVPYSGIAAAFGEICRALKNTLGNMEEKKEEGVDPLTSIGEALVSTLGAEIRLLAKLVPELLALIPSSTKLQEVAESDDLEASQERWKYSFRQLAKVLNSYVSPLVLVLDDLQWADAPSLEVLDYLISDFQNQNPLMIIGCFRSNEITDSHILSNKIQDLAGKKLRFNFNMTDIELGSLQVDDVNKVIMTLLSLDDEEKTKPLAEICFKRTLGNPFFLIEFVTMLKEEKLIDYNLGLLKWIWDNKIVEAKTMSTANVVDLLQARMKKLPADVQLLLRYAACLGSSFALSMLNLVWTKHAAQKATSRPEDFERLLTVLEEGNFIEYCGVSTGVSADLLLAYEYRLTHDKVKEAALSLDDFGMFAFQYEIGAILYHSLSDEELEESLFDVVDLINKGNAKRGSEFAGLNLRAAQKAKSISAFQSASVYVANGIKLLPVDKWISLNRQLTLELYTLGAQIELALGHLDEMEMYSNEVLSQEDCPTLDKVPLYLTKVKKLSNVERKYKEAIKFCLVALEELDCKLPNFLVPVQAISSLLRTVKLAVKTQKDGGIKTQQAMIDPRQKAAMEFLYRVFYACFFTGDDFLMILSATNQVQKTMKYGVSEFDGGQAYCTLGILTVAILGKFDEARQFGETALAINRNYKGSFSEASVIHMTNVLVLSWTQLLQSIVVPLQQAYASGMRSGNTEIAMWAAVTGRFLIPLQMGKPLNPILKQFATCVSQAEELEQHEQVFWLKVMWQMMLNLAGNSNETKVLKGEMFDFENVSTDQNDIIVNFIRLNLLVIFGDFESATELPYGKTFAKNIPGHFLSMRETYLRGVALYAMAIKTKKRKYKSSANKVRKTLQTWIQKGTPNVKHYFSLMNAEQAVLDKKYDIAETHYRDAIVCAARTGHIHDAALYNERYADFLQECLNDKEEAKYRLSEAVKHYREWGAQAKVDSLQADEVCVDM